MLRKNLLALLLTMGLSGVACAGEFLTGEQMGDLIVHGQMTGADGARYDVWIVPGYAGPADNAAEGWRAAGKDLSAYGDPNHYKGIVNVSSRMLSFAGQDAIGHFAFKGSIAAWQEAFTTAQGRVDQEVFGWWLAYPWAIIEATGESTLRIIIGVPGGILVAGLGTTVVPVIQFIWPAGKSVYHAAFKGTILPVAAATWNTVVAPPMALTGTPPTAARADGFWMKRIAPEDRPDPEIAEIKKLLRQWRKTLIANPDIQAVDAEDKDVQRIHREQIRTLNEQLNTHRKELAEKRTAIILQKAQQDAALAPEDREKLAGVLQRHGKGQMVDVLRGDGISREQADVLLNALTGPLVGMEENPANPATPTPEKTDPLLRSLEKIRR